MERFKTTSIKPADVDALQQRLEELKVPHSVAADGDCQTLSIGQDGEFEVAVEKQTRGGHAVFVAIRYDHPVLKSLVDQWLKTSGGQVDDRFFNWHASLSPSVINGIKARWCIDLQGLPATLVKVANSVVVFVFERSVERELSAQLAMKRHRRLKKGEYIRCDDFEVSADDPNEPVIYGWRSEAGSRIYVVTASAPAITLLTLWVIPEGAPVDVHLDEELAVGRD